MKLNELLEKEKDNSRLPPTVANDKEQEMAGGEDETEDQWLDSTIFDT